MPYLLDTHAFLWWITDDPRLSEPARQVIRDASNQILFSAASAWEIAIKARLGCLDFRTEPAELIPRQITANSFVPLPIDARHALQVLQLPPLHRDPFDRILVAQARIEGTPILTVDPLIAQYEVTILW